LNVTAVRSSFGLITLIAGLLVLGCGGAASSNTTSSGSSQSQASQPLTSDQLCAKLSPAALKAITGESWTQPTSPSGSPPPGIKAGAGAVCTLQGESGFSSIFVTLNRSNSVGAKAGYQGALNSGAFHFQPVSGVGEQAAYASQGIGSGSDNVLVVVQGDSLYFLSVTSAKIPTGQGLEPLKKIYALVTG
jgi:hypothetical protein